MKKIIPYWEQTSYKKRNNKLKLTEKEINDILDNMEFGRLRTNEISSKFVGNTNYEQ